MTETRDKKQAVLLIGFPGSTMHNPDRYALELLQEACSDLGSRLFLRIRDKLGLAYYVGAQNFPGLIPGYFAFYAGTMPEKVDLVEQEILREAELLRTQGLTAEELKRSKAKIIGQRKIARQDLGSLAMTTALDELYGLGFSHSETDDAHYEAVTLARKYRPQRFADVAGQDHVTRTLLNALSQNRIAHGYIFSGHRGIGKTTIARILAQALNCRTEIGSATRPTPEPCGICDSCIEIRQGNAVDVIEIDAATNRGIDEIRELRDAVQKHPRKIARVPSATAAGGGGRRKIPIGL